jgi:hypothetical protein
MKKLLVAFLALLLLGCYSLQIREYRPIDLSEKSIMLPPGGSYLLGAIKDVIAKNGWKIFIYRGPVVTQKGASEDLAIDTFKSKYRLALTWSHIDYCIGIDRGALYLYDISVIDNEFGDEVMTMSGRGCESDIVEAFERWLQGSSQKKNIQPDHKI